jgi:glutaminyl-tRNA synthetase
LDATSERVLAVLRPLKVVIDNLSDDHIEQVDAKVFPGRSEEVYKVPFTKTVYIESTDFREKDSKDYYGLAPEKTIMLRYAYPITCTDYTVDPTSGDVVEVHATYDPEYAGKKPPKGVLNWVGQPAPGKQPPTFEARLYSTLFKSANITDDWLGDLNPESLVKLNGCFCTDRLASAKVGQRFQLERLGYFCVDPDSQNGRSIVLNRTVTLKESYTH